MGRLVPAAHPDDPIAEVAEGMVRDQIHRLPVTEPESRHLLRILSTRDLARAITTYGLVSICSEPRRGIRSRIAWMLSCRISLVRVESSK